MSTIKISILTPTIRKEGLPIVQKAIKKQTFKNFEWLIGSPFHPNIPSTTWVIDDIEGGFWGLNRIYNRLIKQAQGELIVSWQDWIYAKPDALQKFWDQYQETGGVISGVGDQYESIDSMGKPHIKIWSDPRKRLDQGSFYECYPHDCEWNFCAVPKQALKDVGGFDEEMDFRCRGVDALQVNLRLDELSWKFYLDQTNESYTIRHGREDYGGQKEWDKTHGVFNGEHEKRIIELKKQKLWPSLNYL